MGDKPVIVCAAINNPMVMHEFEREADGIVVEFGVSRAAVLDVVFGDYDPTGRLPVQMPKDMDTVEKQIALYPKYIETKSAQNTLANSSRMQAPNGAQVFPMLWIAVR